MADADCGQELVSSSLSSILGRSILPSFQSSVGFRPFLATNSFIKDYQDFQEPVQKQAEILSVEQVTAPEVLEQPTVAAPGIEAPVNNMHPPPMFGSMPFGYFNNNLFAQETQHPISEYIRDSARNIDLRQDNDWINSIASHSQNDTLELPTEIQDFVTEGKNQRSYEERRAESKFYKFLHDYKTGELDLGQEEAETTLANAQDHWMETPVDSFAEGISNMHNSAFENAWDEAGLQNAEGWADEYLAGDHERELSNFLTMEYPFIEQNPYIHHNNPFEEGQELLRSGAIAAASLAFEAECQRTSPHPQAWYMLGTTQQENEKDTLAILALHKAIENESTNAQAHLALATSQTNEYMYSEALQSIHNWMNNSALCPNISSSFDLKDSLESVLSQHPQNIDAHVALGTFHTINHDYSLGITAFRNALSVNPNSACLWNKLGASLANSGDWEGAMEAYRNAMEISPTSHRCMYNHAVGLTNSGQNMNAIHQLASLLKGQENSAVSTQFEDARRKSDDVWNLVKINAETLGNDEMVRLAEGENTEGLCRSLGIV